MGSKQSNWHQMNKMATDQKWGRVQDQGIKDQEKQELETSEKNEESMIPRGEENPEARRVREAKDARADD